MIIWNTILDNYRIYNDIVVTLVTISMIITTGEYYYLKNIHPVMNQTGNKNDRNNNDNRFYR